VTFAVVASGIQPYNTATSDPFDSTGADFLVVHVGHTSSSPGTISDSKSNTWTQLTTYSSDSTIFYVVNPIVGASHTITVTGGSFPRFTFIAFSGAATSSVFDKEDGGASTTVGPITPTNDGSLIIAAIASSTGGTSPTVDSPFTLQEHAPYASGQHIGSSIAWYEQGTAASQSAVFSGVTTIRGSSIAVFKAPGGGGGSIVPILNQHRRRRAA